MILRGSNSGIAWLTGQTPEQAPQEKQLFKYSPPGSAMTSALNAGFVSIFFAIQSPICGTLCFFFIRLHLCLPAGGCKINILPYVKLYVNMPVKLLLNRAAWSLPGAVTSFVQGLADRTKISRAAAEHCFFHLLPALFAPGTGPVVHLELQLKISRFTVGAEKVGDG